MKVVTPNGERNLIDKVIREGLVGVAPELMLEWLQFSGGELMNIFLNTQGNVVLHIRHIDMPDHRQGDSLEEVRPSYKIEYPSHTITRVSPLRR